MAFARYGVWVASTVLIGLVIGCSVLGSLVGPQELSENYARMPGTIAESRWQGQTRPADALIDGDPDTVAETSREVLIRLPEPRAVRRVVIRNANYEDVILYVGGRSEGEWKMAARIKQNRERTITLQVNTVTDRIRLRIGNTLDDKMGSAEGALVEAPGIGLRRSTFKPGRPTAGEIEIYGLRSTKRSDDLLF